MKLPRRKFLHLAAGAVALPVMPRVAVAALDYPTRPVRWIVGFPPGGPNDITARLMAEQLSARLHQPFVVENRPGASSNVATEMVAAAGLNRKATRLTRGAISLSSSSHLNGGLFLMPDTFLLVHGAEVTSLAARYACPAVYPYSNYTKIGGLMSYAGRNIRLDYRWAALEVGTLRPSAFAVPSC
jgi:tripartite-type tricarboxylate transporter receptor subunit TctC